MKAAVLRAVGAPLEICDIAIAKPGPREVLIRTKAAGVCHSDLHFIEGSYQYPLPAVLGHESAGVVEAIGSEVRSVAVGDHVITCLSAFCGHCEHCVTGHLSLCASPETKRGKDDEPRLSFPDGGMAMQFLNMSSFAEQMLIHENACVAIRKDMPLDRAALIGCAVMTGYGAVVHSAAVRPGESVAVIGVGGIGLSTIASAALAGAGRIIAIDREPSKEALARQFGATDFVLASDDTVAAVVELTKGGVHHAFECIGLAATAAQAFMMIRRGGLATVIGMIPVGEMVSIPSVGFLDERKIQGSMMGSNRFPVDMPRIVDAYMAGKLDLDAMISRRLPLEQVNEAFAEMKTGKLARSVIVFD